MNRELTKQKIEYLTEGVIETQATVCIHNTYVEVI